MLTLHVTTDFGIPSRRAIESIEAGRDLGRYSLELLGCMNWTIRRDGKTVERGGRFAE